MSSVHRSTSLALRTKVDFEAILFSSAASASTGQCSAGIPRRLKSLFKKSTNVSHTKTIVHGYIFDSWLSRSCDDEFLNLSVPWELDNRDYLDLVQELDLHVASLAALEELQPTDQAKALKSLIESSHLRVPFALELFCWVVQAIWNTKGSQHDHCTQNEQAIFIGIFNSWLTYWSNADLSNEASASVKHAIDGLVSKAIFCYQSSSSSVIFKDVLRIMLQCLEKMAERMNPLDPAVSKHILQTVRLLDQIMIREDPNPQNRMEYFASGSRDSCLKTCQSMSKRSLGEVDSGKSRLVTPRQRSFVAICRSLHQQREQPDVLRNTLSTFIGMPAEDDFDEYIGWVQTTIQQQAPGWRSFVKLKLQFYELFPPALINEQFARTICECCLQHELCAIIDRVAYQHRIDSQRQPRPVLQLGCRLLLSVASFETSVIPAMLERLRLHWSGSIRVPLFGSTDIWGKDVDTILTSTLNQIVVKGDSGPQDSTHVTRTLQQMSIVDPYRVIYRLVQNSVQNKGQSPVLLRVLASVGRLPFLRRSKDDTALLLLVLEDILSYKSPLPEMSSQQQSNLEDFISKATLEEPILIDAKELVERSILVILDTALDTFQKNTPYTRLLTGVLQRLYLLAEKSLVADSIASTEAPLLDRDWMHSQIHWKILLRLMRLGSLERAWDGDEEGSFSDRRAGGTADEGLVESIGQLVRAIGVHVQNLGKPSTGHLEQQTQYATEFFKDVENAKDISRSMALLTTPLLAKCQDKLAVNVTPWLLPDQISFFCCSGLKRFAYDNESGTTVSQWTSLSNYSQSLLMLLAIARLNEEILQDISQAMASNWKFPYERDGVRTVTAGCVYRIMSISTKAETARLLTHCLPAVVNGLEEEALRNPMLFQNAERQISENGVIDTLKVYWMKALEPGVTMQAASATKAIGLLAYLEGLIDLALSPWGQSSNDSRKQALLHVYAFDIGFDLMVDEVVSLGLLSFKAYDVDWTVVSTDKVLVTFLILCRLSHHVNSYAPSHESVKRVGSLTPSMQETLGIDTPHPSDISMDHYEKLLSAAPPETEDDITARIKKAHDELVLASMAHAEGILKRLDVGRAVCEHRLVGDWVKHEVGPRTSSMDPLVVNHGASPKVSSEPPSILKSDDLTCLEAALSYLPSQEQSALRARLVITLPSLETSL